MGACIVVDGRTSTEAAIQALDWKNSTRIATTGALPANTLSGNRLTAGGNGAFAAVDGITLALNESILVKNEAAGEKNGIYTLVQVGDGSNPWILERRSDANTDAEVTAGMTVPVSEGTSNANTAWTLTTPDPITLNTTALTFLDIISGAATLAATLAAGNTTGGTNIVVSDGDAILPATNGNPSIGSTSFRFNEGFINQLLVGGAVSANADASANDAIFGDASAVSRGVTFVGTTTSDMSIAYSDGTLLKRGEIRLENSATPDRWVFRNANVDRAALGTTAWYPTTDEGLGLGIVATNRWSESHITTGYFAGAASGDAVASAADLVIGDGTGDHGLTVFSEGIMTGSLHFIDVVGGALRGAVEYRHTSGDMTVRTEGSARHRTTATAFYPATDEALSLGIVVSNRWAESHITTGYFGGAIVADAVAGNADIVVGSIEAADNGITIVSGTANAGGISFADVAATMRGRVEYDHNLDTLVFAANGADKATITTSALRPVADNGIDLGGDTIHFGNSYITTGYFAGASSGDGVADHANLVIGDGSVPVGITLFGDLAGTGSSGIAVTDVLGTAQGGIDYDLTNNRWFFRTTNGTSRMRLDANSLDPGVDGSQSLGSTASLGWMSLALTERADHVGTPTATRAEVWLINTATQSLMLTDDAGADWQIGGDTQTLNTLLVAGAAAANGPATANEIVIGAAAAATDYGISIYTDTDRAGSVNMTDSSGNVVGSWRYDHNLNDHVWTVSGVDVLQMTNTSLYTVNDTLGLGESATAGWTSLVLDERADHVGTPTATRAEVWLVNTAPNVLMLTNDAGVDLPLSNEIEPSAGTITAANKRTIMADATSGTVTIDLPLAAAGKFYDIIVLSTANTVTVTRQVGDNINGAGSNKTISTVGRYIVTAEDATDWWLHGPVTQVA